MFFLSSQPKKQASFKKGKSIMEQAKYDVFISYSRKDYVENDQIIPGNPISAIIDLFDKNCISYWIDRKGIYVGEEFVKEISKAINNSKMLVFVSSKNSNESDYTCGEILKAKKAKKTIIPFRIDECDYNENFEILLLPLNHIDYEKQPNTALPELLRTVNGEKKRIEKEEADKKEKQAIMNAKNDIKEKAKEFHALTGQQDSILQELYAKNKLIGNNNRRCPVCGNVVPLWSLFCDKCSWQFPKLYSLDGSEIPICDETQLALARTHWQGLNNVAKLQKDNKMLNIQLQDSETKREELEKNREELEKQLETLKKQATVSVIGQDSLDIYVNDKVSFKMIRVEGGSMGTFYIGETQVIQALWEAVMGNNPSYFEGQKNPVEYVSWYDICGEDGKGTDPNCFLYRLNQKTGKNFRLPTEAEWEYAAKGGNKSMNNYIYAGSDDINKVAWYWKNSGDNYLKGGDDDYGWDKTMENSCKTHPVKQLSPNELGIYDMSGNVWEWCEDLYDSSGSDRVRRGGSWISLAENCRLSVRHRSDPDFKHGRVGFRLVLPQ